MKLTKTEIDVLLVTIRHNRREWRFGQCVFNFGSVYPIIEQYRATKYDPFHNDAIVLSLFELILDNTAAQHWYSTEEFKQLVDQINS